MASGWYNAGVRDVADGTINLNTDTIKVILVSSAYTPNKGHAFASELTGEISGTGYVGGFAGAGRKTLSGKSFTTDAGNNRVKFTFSTVTWAAINAGSPKYAILVKEVANDAGSRLIAYLDLGTVTTNGGDLSITPDATNGALQWNAV